MEKLIKVGAEAKIIWKDSVIIKERVKKRYRIDELDKKLRKERTGLEASILEKCRRFGVDVPKVISYDKQQGKIEMEFIDGPTLKEVIEKKRLNVEKLMELMKEVGAKVANMHINGIVHGDLTTSNMILKYDKVYFIDFGLGFYTRRVEDFATDLKLFEDVLRASHTEVFGACWQAFVEGYKSVDEAFASKVLERMEDIRKRARYVER